jgi:stress response protein YsnF
VREVVRLREERAVVERRAVDRPATAGDLSTFKEGTLEVREKVEEPVVAKSARVVEEVRVGKEVREREEAIEDTVRRKDVDVQQLEGSRNIERERAVASDSMRNNAQESREGDRAVSNEREIASDARTDDTTGKPRKNR